ncbi:MFS transporter [Oceanisphaera profunda]|uniref:MFS transporter n=1 Tax=Oceanisphaera profunda TaxID=1416627 RepID=A0A1Y0D601_9GAMM|nr:MFS transporter [Oceanisphaera profunda]ART82960.1 MFS transporter [Oceanisphaera profunda]
MPITVWGLTLAQALLMSGNILLVSISALVGKELAAHPALMTLPIACQFIGVICATLPAAHLMQRLGRKTGFVVGNLIGLLGTWVSLQGLLLTSLSLFALGTFLIGIAIGVGQQYRFAALEACAQPLHARAISMVMAGGVLAAIIGPNLAILSQDWHSASPYAGAFYGLFGLYVLALCLIMMLPLPKPAVINAQAQIRSYGQLFAQPLLLAAVASGMIGYGIMVLIMTATPLAMNHDQHDFSATAYVIQWHVLGMFVPSFFTGALIRRFSTRRVILWGCGALLASVLVNLTGQGFWNYWWGLLLLGVGWNFTFIGATHLLTFSYQPAEKAKVQGINEFMVFSAAAVGSLFAGQGLVLLGWAWLNLFAIPWILLVAWLIWRLKEQPEEQRLAPGTKHQAKE